MPTETVASAAIAAKYGLLAKLVTLLSAGVIGAILIAAVDPTEAEADPRKRRKLIVSQVVVAMLVTGLCGPLVVSWLGKPGGWLPVAGGDVGAVVELAMPVGLLLGALSWGLIGAAVKLRRLIDEKAAKALASKVGIEGTGVDEK